MSTDQIFAAQMWSWADPMIKRDSHGRILVVNAAFLQLYGGSVENWTGNPVQGWPMPKSPGEISRFESRIPLPTGGETVYDWMECTHQDGTAIAMARDVTAYAAMQRPVPKPAEMTAKPVSSAPQQADPIHTAEQMPADTGFQAVSTSDFINQSQQNAPEQTAQAMPAMDTPAVEAAPSLAPAAAALTATTVAMAATPAMAQPEAIAAETVQAPVAYQAAETPIAQAAFTQAMEQTPQPAHAEIPPMPVAPAAPATPAAPLQQQAQPVQDNRDFERRALPIENEDAILGNNWRDAVIAKAVGVEDTAEEASEEDAPAAPSIAKENGEQVKVLLAEDNAINALLTRTLLEAEGCLCDVVEDGVLAVEAVKNNQYDLVFMDMRMPNMDGLEATRKIRAMGYNAKVLPIVALTANAFDDDRNACFDSGMNDFMTKPVSAEELSAMVTTHTELTTEKIAS